MKKYILSIAFMLTIAGAVSAQSLVVPSNGAYIGGGYHVAFSLSEDNNSYHGPAFNVGYAWDKFFLTAIPQFNFYKETIQGINTDGTDFSVPVLGGLRINDRFNIGAGLNVQVTEKNDINNKWDWNFDFALLAGAGYSFQLNKASIGPSLFFKYNPSAENLSMGIDLSVNFPL